MINVGIIGAASPHAGELMRILVNHPDVSIRCASDSSMAGCDVTSAHHGLIGECDLEFSDKMDYSKLDVLFVAGDPHSESVPDPLVNPDLCVIDLWTPFGAARQQDSLVVFGVPEFNRKALVRGAKRAVIPSALDSVVTVALLPLAMKALLPETIHITMEGSAEVLEENHPEIDKDGTGRLIQVEKEFQSSGCKPFLTSVTSVKEDLGRVIRISCNLELPMPVDNVTDMYEDFYSDHNLTFIVGEPVDEAEVEGTDKCIVSLDRAPEGHLQLTAIADAWMRGGAGDAVHVMNLLQGLFEKTGLSLKASRF